MKLMLRQVIQVNSNKIVIAIFLISLIFILGCTKKADTDTTKTDSDDDLENDADSVGDDLGLDDLDEITGNLDEIDSLDY